MAEAAAKLLDLPIEDSREGRPIVREAGTHDLSLRDKRRRAERAAAPRRKVHLSAPPGTEPAARPAEQPSWRSRPRPIGTRIQDRADGETTVIELPPSGWGPSVGALVFGLFPLGLGVVFLAAMLRSADCSGMGSGELGAFVAVAGLVGLLFFVLPLYAVVLPAIESALARVTLRVDPVGLDYRETGLLRDEVVDLPADEVEEVEVVPFADKPQGRIVVRTDRVEVTFGGGLGADEIVWLRDVLYEELTREP
jgi:hypothetical protein